MPSSRTARVDQGVCVRVGERVQVGGVLRPDHQVRSGDATGAHVGGELTRGGDVVVEHRGALGVELQPQPRHVALHERDAHRRPARRHRNGQRGRDRGDDAAHQHDDDPSRACTPRQHRPGEHPAEQRHDERHQRRAAERSQRQQHAVGLAEGQPAPREAAEGQPRPQRLLEHPEQRDDHRPAAVPGRERQRRSEQGEERRLQQRQRHESARTGVGGRPLHQRQEQREPVHQAQQRRPAQTRSATAQRQQRHGRRCERPEPRRREGEVGQQPRRAGAEQLEPQHGDGRSAGADRQWATRRPPLASRRGSSRAHPASPRPCAGATGPGGRDPSDRRQDRWRRS